MLQTMKAASSACLGRMDRRVVITDARSCLLPLAMAGEIRLAAGSARLAACARFLGRRPLWRLLALDRQQHFPLPFDPLAALLRLRRGRALGLHAASQRIHEIDDVAAPRNVLLGLRRLEAGLLLA